MKQEINFWGKLAAGFFLIFFTALSAIMIIGYWPDKLPDPKDKIRIAPLYKNELFNIRLAGIPDSSYIPECVYDGTCDKDTSVQQPDSLEMSADSTATVADSMKTAPGRTVRSGKKIDNGSEPISLIHINTLILILVALGGFLGNMIHIATSLTTFVGDKKFERSWVLWYVVKPFTAAALAVGFYFVFRGGFLNMSDDASNINLYGLMTISILTGLFTDTATLKLKEVFEVLFKPKDSRTGKLDDEITIIDISPSTLEKDIENKLVITGKNMVSSKIALFMNDEPIVNPVVTPAAINFVYTIPDTQKDATSFKLAVKDDKGKEYKTFDLTLKGTDSGDSTNGNASTGENGENTGEDPGLG